MNDRGGLRRRMTFATNKQQILFRLINWEDRKTGDIVGIINGCLKLEAKTGCRRL